MSGRKHVSADGRPDRYRTRRLPIADGATLKMHGDGTIERIDAAGAVVERWGPDEPGWAGHALRFGLHVSSSTVAPSGRDVPGEKPPA